MRLAVAFVVERMTHAADLHIGTSGWHYDHWIGPFYPPGTRAKGCLEHYARHFKTVEINNTFYGLPTRHAVMNGAMVYRRASCLPPRAAGSSRT
jgi:Protein of unknown function DUF72